MSEIEIYDSQGASIGDSDQRKNDRIQNFFFAGVRMSIDTTGEDDEVVCFFRARENESGRSEQYYAVYKSEDICDLGAIGTALEEQIEDDLDLILDTRLDDTTVFNLLRSNENPSSPLQQYEIGDIIEVISNREQAKFGTSAYRDAFAILCACLNELSNGKFAIVDNIDSANFAEYNLVIEKGSYTGVEPFAETAEAIKGIKRRRRQQDDPDQDGWLGWFEFWG